MMIVFIISVFFFNENIYKSSENKIRKEQFLFFYHYYTAYHILSLISYSNFVIPGKMRVYVVLIP